MIAPFTPEHCTIDRDAARAYCKTCQSGIDCSHLGDPFRFHTLNAFLVGHAVHNRKGSPAGLTPTGATSKAARTYFEQERT